jgi:topoisomerase-4 subunit A
MLDRARDESDRTHPVRLVFEPKSSRQDENEFVNLLLAKTSMETNASINLVMVGLDGRPTGKDLKEILVEWLEFRFATVTRRSRFRLDKVLDRIHVLEGRLLVLLNVDKVIKLIRNSDDPKPDLMRVFKLTDRQAEDILEMRLRQLAKLEHIKLEKELEGLSKEQKGLEKVLGSRKSLESLVIEEIEADVKAFGDKRRTVIEESEKAVLETPVLDEPVTVVFSKNGWVRARQGHGVEPASLSFKEGDSLAALIPCRTVDPVIFLDSAGRAYSVEAAGLPSARGDGAPASSLVEVQGGAKVMHCVAGKSDTKLLVASSGGYGFLCSIGDMVSNRRAGREFMSVDAGETPLLPFAYADAPGNHVIALSGEGRLLAFDIAEMRAMSKGRGVVVMGLETGERLLAVAVASLGSVTVSGIGRGGKEKALEIKGEKLRHHVGHRARKGRVLPEKLKQPMRLAVPPMLQLDAD